MWQPVNFEADAAPAPPEGAPPGTPGVPTGAELDNWSQQTYNLSRSGALSLGFSIGEVDAEANQRVLVAESARYKEISDLDGKSRLRYGVALRLIVLASEYSGESALSLPMLAAKAQVGQAQTSTSIVLRGYRGDKVNLPEIKVLTVETYAEWLKTISEMQSVFTTDVASLSPVLLARLAPEPTPESLAPAVGQVWALAEIAQGKALRHALAQFPSGQREGQEDEAAMQAVQATYQLLVGGSDDEEPGDEQRSLARGRLLGLDVRT